MAVTSPFNGALGGTSWTIGTSITDAPIVDGTIGRVFVFANDTGTGALVGEADTSLGTHTGPVIVGSSTTSPFHSGDFENHHNSDTGAGTGTGFLYVCGNNGAANHPDLYQIPVTSGTIGLTATSEFVAATASVECSPVTEFYNTTTSQDSIFFSVHNNAAAGTDCATHGCLFAATLGPNGPAETVTISGAILASGGTSGVVVDNNSSTSGCFEYLLLVAWKFERHFPLHDQCPRVYGPSFSAGVGQRRRRRQWQRGRQRGFAERNFGFQFCREKRRSHSDSRTGMAPESPRRRPITAEIRIPLSVPR